MFQRNILFPLPGDRTGAEGCWTDRVQKKYVSCRGGLEELGQTQPQKSEDGVETEVWIHACCGGSVQTTVKALVQFACAQRT